MTIDGWDWLHLTGPNPPHDPVPGDLCNSAPARPFEYEATFAHEYQHLLQHYQDFDETVWVDEGLAMWSEKLTGYSEPDIPVTDIGWSRHVQDFLGHAAKRTDANPNPLEGGPENSLTRWGDQGDRELRADYGAAYTFMLYLEQRYGQDLLTALHRANRNGFEGLQRGLEAHGDSAADVVHQWAAMVALDATLDDGATLTGGNDALYQVDALNASINWWNRDSHGRKGAPPNGSDYVRLRDGDGEFLDAGSIDRIRFDGADRLLPLPIEWRVARNPRQHVGNPAFHSGRGANMDRAIVRRVKVPVARPHLTFSTKWKTEARWDYGFVQVFTDGGKAYRSLGNEYTDTTPVAGAIDAVKENQPGLTGSSKGWKKVRFNLERYAGRSILLSFRYITDFGVNLPGWWVDKIQIGGKRISAGKRLKGWRSATQVRRTPVRGYTLQLVAYRQNRSRAWIAPIDLGPGFTATLDAHAVGDAVGRSAEVVAAIVTQDDPTEEIWQYAPYRLVVNGTLQKGG
jgi:hypothetical protein